LGYLVRFRYGPVACGAALAVALALAGCGRRGPLEPPVAQAPATTPAQKDAQARKDATDQTIALQNTDEPGLIQSPNTVYEQSALAKLNSATSKPPPRPINAPPVASPNAFFLDPLIK
jgi:predicted small lipoprotein YifL